MPPEDEKGEGGGGREEEEEEEEEKEEEEEEKRQLHHDPLQNYLLHLLEVSSKLPKTVGRLVLIGQECFNQIIEWESGSNLQVAVMNLGK